MKSLLISLFWSLLLLSLTGRGAETPKCTLTAAQLPHASELQGLYLGMNVEAFQTRWPKLKIVRTDDLGSAALNVFPAFEPNIDRATLPDVRTVSLEFLDGKLTSLWIGYDSSFKWQELEEFAAGIASALRLPTDWEASARSRQLDCADFAATISMVGQSPTIKLVNKTAQQTLEKRRAEKEAMRP